MELVENPYVSEFTKKTLEQFGWKDGDAIPVELGELLVRLKDGVPASPRTDVLVDAASLPPEAIQQVREMLVAANKVAANRNKQLEDERAVENMNPEVAALYQQLASAGPEIVDDRPEDAAAEPAAEPEAPAAKEPEAPVPDEPVSPPMVILPFCPRCGWDMRQKFDVEITEQVKQEFVAAILGGTRFQQRIELLGGKLNLTFRSLLADENKLVHRQLVLDQQDGEITTEAEWVLRMLEYRLACSLDQVTDQNGRPLHVVPPVLEYPHTPPTHKPLQTALVPLLEYINTKILAHEVTRRLAAQQLRQFQRLVEALEAMALEPSFWNGIG